MPKGSSRAHQWLKGGGYLTLEDLEKKAEPAQIHGLFWILPGLSLFTSFVYRTPLPTLSSKFKSYP